MRTCRGVQREGNSEIFIFGYNDQIFYTQTKWRLQQFFSIILPNWAYEGKIPDLTDLSFPGHNNFRSQFGVEHSPCNFSQITV